MDMRVALFDMDGTLVRKNTAALYIRYEYEIGRAQLSQVLRVLWWRARYWLGQIEAEQIVAQALRWYAGRSEAELRRELPPWFERYVKPHISDAARRAVREHQQRGDVTAIVSSSTPYITDLVAEELGIEHVICSRLSVCDGVLSGEVELPLCYGPGKVLLAQRWLETMAEQAGLERATAYGDSITDLPLLEAVEQPVAVNPDPSLLCRALARGWTIQRW